MKTFLIIAMFKKFRLMNRKSPPLCITHQQGWALECSDNGFFERLDSPDLNNVMGWLGLNGDFLFGKR